MAAGGIKLPEGGGARKLLVLPAKLVLVYEIAGYRPALWETVVLAEGK